VRAKRAHNSSLVCCSARYTASASTVT
jgi:hypothetical protein